MLGKRIHERNADPDRQNRFLILREAQGQRNVIRVAIHNRGSIGIQQRITVITVIEVFLIFLFFLVPCLRNLQSVIIQVVQSPDQFAQFRVSKGIVGFSLFLHPDLILVQQQLQDVRPEANPVRHRCHENLRTFQPLRQRLQPVKELAPGLRQLLLGSADSFPHIHMDAERLSAEAHRHADDLPVLFHRLLQVGIQAVGARRNLLIGAQVRQVVPAAHRTELIAVVLKQIHIRAAVPVQHLLQDFRFPSPVRLQDHGDVSPCIVHRINRFIGRRTPGVIRNPQRNAAALGRVGILGHDCIGSPYHHITVRQQEHTVAVVRAVIHSFRPRHVKLGYRPQFTVFEVIQGILFSAVGRADPGETHTGKHGKLRFTLVCQIQAVDLDRYVRIIIPFIPCNQNASLRPGSHLVEVVTQFHFRAGPVLQIDQQQFPPGISICGQDQLIFHSE